MAKVNFGLQRDRTLLIEDSLAACADGHGLVIYNTFSTAECPVCDGDEFYEDRLKELRKKNKSLRDELKLAKYELRDARDKLSKYKSDNAEFLAMKKQARDAVSERIK